MKRWKKLTLVLFVLLMVSQAPFLDRRRHLGLLQNNIDGLLAERVPPALEDAYMDYRGVIHVHSRLGGQKIALRGGVRFVVQSPQRGRIVLLRNGQVEQTRVNAGPQEFMVRRNGVYRIEIYLDRLEEPLDGYPWIISNPIYVR